MHSCASGRAGVEISTPTRGIQRGNPAFEPKWLHVSDWFQWERRPFPTKGDAAASEEYSITTVQVLAYSCLDSMVLEQTRSDGHDSSGSCAITRNMIHGAPTLSWPSWFTPLHPFFPAGHAHTPISPTVITWHVNESERTRTHVFSHAPTRSVAPPKLLVFVPGEKPLCHTWQRSRIRSLESCALGSMVVIGGSGNGRQLMQNVTSAPPDSLRYISRCVASLDVRHD